MKCPACSQRVSKRDKFCQSCGYTLIKSNERQTIKEPRQSTEDQYDLFIKAGILVASLMFPLVGIILYIVMRYEKNEAYARYALIGFVINIVFYTVMFILFMGLLFAAS